MDKKKRDEIPKKLREAIRRLQEEPIPPGIAKHLPPDEPPPTSTPGAARLAVPTSEPEPATSSVACARSAHRGRRSAARPAAIAMTANRCRATGLVTLVGL